MPKEALIVSRLSSNFLGQSGVTIALEIATEQEDARHELANRFEWKSTSSERLRFMKKNTLSSRNKVTRLFSIFESLVVRFILFSRFE